MPRFSLGAALTTLAMLVFTTPTGFMSQPARAADHRDAPADHCPQPR
jgi:hypothetical protein